MNEKLCGEITEIWVDLLGEEKIDPSDNFFALGGDSMQLVDMVVALCSRYGTDFDYETFLETPTIQTLLKLYDASSHKHE